MLLFSSNARAHAVEFSPELLARLSRLPHMHIAVHQNETLILRSEKATSEMGNDPDSSVLDNAPTPLDIILEEETNVWNNFLRALLAEQSAVNPSQENRNYTDMLFHLWFDYMIENLGTILPYRSAILYPIGRLGNRFLALVESITMPPLGAPEKALPPLFSANFYEGYINAYIRANSSDNDPLAKTAELPTRDQVMTAVLNLSYYLRQNTQDRYSLTSQVKQFIQEEHPDIYEYLLGSGVID